MRHRPDHHGTRSGLSRGRTTLVPSSRSPARARFQAVVPRPTDAAAVCDILRAACSARPRPATNSRPPKRYREPRRAGVLDAVDQVCCACRRVLPSCCSLSDSVEDYAGATVNKIDEIVVGCQHPHVAIGHCLRCEVLQVACEEDRRPTAETCCDVGAVAGSGERLIPPVQNLSGRRPAPS